MEQYSLYGALRAKGLIKLKSRLPVILHTMIMIILSQKSITHIPRYMVGESPNRDVVGIMLPLRMLLFKNTFIIRKKVSIIRKNSYWKQLYSTADEPNSSRSFLFSFERKLLSLSEKRVAQRAL